MALLDVTEVLFDPDFADTITCIREMQTVNGSGLASTTPTPSTFTGVVTQDDGDVMQRMPDGEMVSGSITIHTVFRLSAGGPGQNADIVTWQGRNYTVKTISDYSNFGAGFIAANCELIPVTG
jgi:hypothetical protein